MSKFVDMPATPRHCAVCGELVQRRTNVAAPHGQEDSTQPFLHVQPPARAHNVVVVMKP